MDESHSGSGVKQIQRVLTQHVSQTAPVHPSLGVQVVQVVLDELQAGGEVRLVELVGDVPAERTKLTPLLRGEVKVRIYQPVEAVSKKAFIR